MMPLQQIPKKILLGTVTILLLLKIILWIIFPDAGNDGPIYLSHTFSVLNGTPFLNNFLSEYIHVFNFPYLFGFINAPFYFIFSGTMFQGYSIFIWNILWIILFLYGSYILLKKSDKAILNIFFISLAFLVNTYTYSVRSEIFILPFFVLLQFQYEEAFIKGKPLFIYLAVPLTITVIGLMHPVAGLLACIFTLLFAIDKQIKFWKIAGMFLICGCFIVIFYLPVILIDVQSWKDNFLQVGYLQREHSVTDLAPLFKYISYNPLLFFLFFLVFVNSKNLYREILYWVFFGIVICYFHQSYYYQYLFAFLVWRIKETGSLNYTGWIWKLAAFFFVYGFSIVYILPFFQFTENQSYVQTYKNIEQYLVTNVAKFPQKKIWVPGDAAMPVLDKANVRLHWEYVLDYKKTMNKVDTSSVFFITHLNQAAYIKQYAFEPGVHLSMQQILAPVKGLITISPGFVRSDSLGLWQINVLNN